MQYHAKVHEDADGYWLAEFPDCAGCQTFGETKAEAIAMAADALDGWLEVSLEHGDVPPKPKYTRGVGIRVAPGLSAAIALRWARARFGVTQAQLAKQAGVSQQQVAKLEQPGANPTVETLQKVAEALGGVFDLVFVARADARAEKADRAKATTATTKKVPAQKKKPAAGAANHTAAKRSTSPARIEVVRTGATSKPSRPRRSAPAKDRHAS